MFDGQKARMDIKFEFEIGLELENSFGKSVVSFGNERTSVRYCEVTRRYEEINQIG